jgi:hypothetical protein
VKCPKCAKGIFRTNYIYRHRDACNVPTVFKLPGIQMEEEGEGHISVKENAPMEIISKIAMSEEEKRINNLVALQMENERQIFIEVIKKKDEQIKVLKDLLYDEQTLTRKLQEQLGTNDNGMNEKAENMV